MGACPMCNGEVLDDAFEVVESPVAAPMEDSAPVDSAPPEPQHPLAAQTWPAKPLFQNLLSAFSFRPKPATPARRPELVRRAKQIETALQRNGLMRYLVWICGFSGL